VPAFSRSSRCGPATASSCFGAEALGVADGASVEFFFSPPFRLADGSQSIGDKLEPLAGAVAQLRRRHRVPTTMSGSWRA
jgi:hypothetical protein